MKRTIAAMLVLMVAGWGQPEPLPIGTWYLTDTEWADLDTLEPPRSMKLLLSSDGTATLESAIVSRSYRTTVDGCFVHETRRDEHELQGTYQLTIDEILFRWNQLDGSKALLDGYFLADGSGSYRWPRPLERELKVELVDKTITVERIDSQD